MQRYFTGTAVYIVANIMTQKQENTRVMFSCDISLSEIGRRKQLHQSHLVNYSSSPSQSCTLAAVHGYQLIIVVEWVGMQDARATSIIAH